MFVDWDTPIEEAKGRSFVQGEQCLDQEIDGGSETKKSDQEEAFPVWPLLQPEQLSQGAFSDEVWLVLHSELSCNERLVRLAALSQAYVSALQGESRRALADLAAECSEHLHSVVAASKGGYFDSL